VGFSARRMPDLPSYYLHVIDMQCGTPINQYKHVVVLTQWCKQTALSTYICMVLGSYAGTGRIGRRRCTHSRTGTSISYTRIKITGILVKHINRRHVPTGTYYVLVFYRTRVLEYSSTIRYRQGTAQRTMVPMVL
jgi:hypothetical protein